MLRSGDGFAYRYAAWAQGLDRMLVQVWLIPPLYRRARAVPAGVWASGLGVLVLKCLASGFAPSSVHES